MRAIAKRPRTPGLPSLNGISESGILGVTPGRSWSSYCWGGRERTGGYGPGVGNASRPCISWGENTPAISRMRVHPPLGWVRGPDPYPGNVSSPLWVLGPYHLSGFWPQSARQPHGCNNSASYPAPLMEEGAGGLAWGGHPPGEAREAEQEEGAGGHDSSLEAAGPGTGGAGVHLFPGRTPESGLEGMGLEPGGTRPGGGGSLRIHSQWASAGDACEGVKKSWPA